MESYSDELDRIHASLPEDGFIPDALIDRVVALIDEYPGSAELYIVAASFIQLGSADTGKYSLEDALEFLLKSITVEPSNWSGYEELGFIHYAVLDDASSAVRYFDQALELGAGDSSVGGKASALIELGLLDQAAQTLEHATDPADEQIRIARESLEWALEN